MSKLFTDQRGKAWGFRDADSPETIARMAAKHGVTLTPITAEEHQSIVNPPPTFGEAQASKKAELEQAFQAEQGADIEFTTQGGVTKDFQADAVSQELLLKAVVGFDLIGGTPPEFCWVAKDNTQVPVTLPDLKGLYSAMLARGGAAFQRLQDRKQAVRDAEDSAAIAAITWESAE
jgi:hypothetical protein